MSATGQEAVDTQVPQSPYPVKETKLPTIIKKHPTDAKKKKRLTLKPKNSTAVLDSFVAPTTSPMQRGQVVSMRKLNARQSSNKTLTLTPQQQLEMIKTARYIYSYCCYGQPLSSFIVIFLRC